MRAIINNKDIYLGTCYYPEHWPKEMWADDIRRMLSAGIKVVRIAEFAWSMVEIREGEFNYDFFDDFLDLASQMGMKVIFSTPTATPPAWLTNKYPEVLNCDIDGHNYYHGARRHYNYNSPIYLKFCDRIVEAFASHYANHEAIIGWQIDNELNCEVAEFYSPSDTLAFRKFLIDKYDSIDTLNKSWGTTFWNQTYTDWDEIFVPRKTCSYSTNPHEVLDYYRFISDSACRFAKRQSDILRKYIKPDDFITTNGLFSHLDYQRLNRESLDFITYDSYPNFAYCLDSYNDNDVLKDRRWSRHLTETRAISPVFGIMEQQSGANGWNTRMEAPSPRPGQMSLWTMQSISHGADFVSYFRWRTATQGTEIYWHGILDYSGRENERLRELISINKQIEKMQEIAGAKFIAQVGIICDYDNHYDAEIDKWHQRVQKQSYNALFKTLEETHTPFDFVYIDEFTSIEKLIPYKVLFYPHASVMNENLKNQLESYVAQGGTLILGCRTAYKDITGKCVMDKLPGMLTLLSGTDVYEYSFIAPDIKQVKVKWNDKTFNAAVFIDRIQATTDSAEIIGTYESDYFKGAGAIVKNKFKNGTCYYYGSAFTDEAVEAFLNECQVNNPYASKIDAPKECEITIRENDNGKFMFILNYLKTAVTINVKEEAFSILDETEVFGEVQLKPYGYTILKFTS